MHSTECSGVMVLSFGYKHAVRTIRTQMVLAGILHNFNFFPSFSVLLVGICCHNVSVGLFNDTLTVQGV
jgi:hypothetical protein